MTDMVWHRPPTRQSCQSTSRVVLAVSALMLGACVLSVLRRDSGTALSGSAEFTPRDQNLTGVDAGRAIVTWPLKADDSPVGIIMAGSVLGNQAVLEKALGEDGTLSDWKAQSKKAATALVQEAMEEIIDDDPFENRPGQRAVDEHELRDVVAKAQRLAYPAGDIASGGEETGQAHHVANAEAQAAAVMAANEAAVVDTYDMPHPPEAANDKPFAHESGRAGIFKTQKRVSGSSNWPGVMASRVKGPKIKTLSLTHKVKGPSQHELIQRFVKPDSARVAGGWKRALSAPSARLQSLLQEGDDAADRAGSERSALGIRNLFSLAQGWVQEVAKGTAAKNRAEVGVKNVAEQLQAEEGKGKDEEEHEQRWVRVWYKQQAVERKEQQKEDAWKRQAQIECEQDHKAAVEAGYRSPEEEEEGEEDGSALDHHVSEADFYGGSTAAAVLGDGASEEDTSSGCGQAIQNQEEQISAEAGSD